MIEVRAPRHGQGRRRCGALRRGAARPAAFLFAGDDLGDLEAFEAVASLRAQGLPALLVCSRSDEQPALAELADVVVDGPDGVLDLLRQLTADAAATAPEPCSTVGISDRGTRMCTF